MFKELIKIVHTEDEAKKYISDNQKDNEKELKYIEQTHPTGTKFIVIYTEMDEIKKIVSSNKKSISIKIKE